MTGPSKRARNSGSAWVTAAWKARLSSLRRSLGPREGTYRPSRPARCPPTATVAGGGRERGGGAVAGGGGGGRVASGAGAARGDDHGAGFSRGGDPAPLPACPF